MFAIRNGLKATSRLSGIIARNDSNSVICAPPEVKISTAEKFVALFLIGAAMLGTPMYMAPRFKQYAAKERSG